MSYQENILQAVDMVVSQRLHEMSFDKTIVCRVENDENTKKGEYTVSYQAMTMVVYAANPEEEYKKGQDVYVTVPQGDFNLRKIIIGYVSPSEIPTYLYTNPMKYLVKLSDNLIADEAILNSENSSAAAINNSIILRDYSEEGNMPPIKYLCFAADFSTSGTPDYAKKYGIKIIGEGVLKENKTVKEKFEWTFDSTKFQGNPYAFNGLFRQEQLFNIERFSELNNLTIELLDDNFPVTVSNIELVYGYAKEDLTKDNIYDKIILYEENEKDIYSENDKTLILKLQYIKKENENITIEPVADGDVTWYVYYVGAEDQGIGRNWGVLQDITSNQLDLTGEQYNLKLNNNDTIKINLPDPEMKSLQIIAKYKDLVSNNLVFLEENEKDLQSALTGSGIELVSDKTNFLYNGANNELIDNQNKGTITAKLTGAAIWLEGMAVTWKIPKKGSMFTEPEGDEVDKTSDNDYYIINHKVKHKTDPTLTFKVQDNYILGATNNVIKCEAIYPDYGAVYDSISIGFDIKGTAGTEYTFKIEIENEYDHMPWGYFADTEQAATIKATAVFLDPSGKEVTEGFSYDNVSWSFASEYINPTSDYSFFAPKTGTGKEFVFQLNKENFQNGDRRKNYHGILKAKFLQSYTVNENGNKVQFETYCPIVVNLRPGLTGYSGASQVLYDFQGGNPQYSQDVYDIIGVKLDNIDNFKIYQKDEDNPIIKLKDNKLYPSSLMPSGNLPKATVTKGGYQSGSYHQILIPLLIMRNSYTSDLLNSWNEDDLVIDNNNNKNYILTRMIGAGTKNSQNQFSGVFMGAVGSETNNDATTGLYGYKDGTLRFKFTEKGEGYIGTGDDNHIEFADGKFEIKTKKFTLDSTKLYLSGDTTNKNGYYFNLGNKLTFDGSNLNIVGSGTFTGSITASSGKIDNLIIAPNHYIYVPSTKDVNTNVLTSYGFGFMGNGGSTGTNPVFYAGYDITKNSAGTPYPSGAQAWREHTAFSIAYNGSFNAGRTTKNTALFHYNAVKNAIYIRDINGNTVFSVETDPSKITFNAPITGYVSQSAFDTYKNDVTANYALKTSITGANIVGWGINSSKFYISSNNGEVFSVTSSGLTVKGHIEASSGTFKGTLQAGSILGNDTNGVKCTIKDGKWVLGGLSTNSNGEAYTQLIIGKSSIQLKNIPTTPGSGGNSIISVSENRIELHGGSSSILMGYYLNGNLTGTWYYENKEIATDGSGSDYRIKHDINPLSQKYSTFFDQLEPISFIYNQNNKFNYGTSQRVHLGFIANNVEKALVNSNLTNQDFAGLVIQDMGTEEETYFLRYYEFVPLNTWQIQKLKIRVAELETELAEIKEKLQ